MTDMIHVFEKAGLGKAPFRFVGVTVEHYQACPGAPVQPGTSCDYCGTAITNVFHIKSSDGKSFKVGCECVRKTGDAGLQRKVDQAARKLLNDQRHAREAEKLAIIKAALADPALREKLRGQPHPLAWAAAKGMTLLDSADWMWSHAGTTGRLKLGKDLGVL